MSNISRLYRGESTTFKAFPDQGTLFYKVLGYPSSVDAINALQAASALVDDDGIRVGVKYGDPHPENADLKATQFTASEQLGSGDDAGWVITVSFVRTDLSFSIDPPADIKDPNYLNASFSNTVERISVPLFVARPVFIPFISNDGSNGGEPDGELVTSYQYERESFEVDTPFTTLKIILNLGAGDYNTSNFADVDEQYNRIHTLPDNRKYQFKGYTSSQVSNQVWRIEYTWKRDPGNPGIENIGTNQSLFAITNSPDEVFPPTTLPTPFGVTKYIYPYNYETNSPVKREAYTDYKFSYVSVVESNPSRSITFPYFDANDPYIYPFVEEPSGWSNLPGLPVQRAAAGQFVGGA